MTVVQCVVVGAVMVVGYWLGWVRPIVHREWRDTAYRGVTLFAIVAATSALHLNHIIARFMEWLMPCLCAVTK